MEEMKPDESQFMDRIEPQWMIEVKSPFRFEAMSGIIEIGGLRLALMHNLTEFSYYIIIVISEGKIALRYTMIVA